VPEPELKVTVISRSKRPIRHSGPNGGIITAYTTLTRPRRAESDSIAQSEEARIDLRASEERFGKALAQAAVGMSLTGTNGRYLQVNDAFCSIFGFTREELGELDSYSITHPEDRERYAAINRRMLAGEINDYIIEKRCLRKDGDAVWVRNSVSLAHDAEGKPSDIITLTEDITARKNSEDASANKARLIALGAEVGVALTRIQDLQGALQSCVESVVRHQARRRGAGPHLDRGCRPIRTAIASQRGNV
jgi:PAS domain S-box-containing protein